MTRPVKARPASPGPVDAPQFWLLKSEPEVFSWDDLVAAGVEPWTGVRSHHARNNLALMRTGQHAFFYHSTARHSTTGHSDSGQSESGQSESGQSNTGHRNTGREIVGVCEVVREAYPDPTAEAGAWVCVDVRAVRRLARPVSLIQMKADPALEGFALLRLSRLSVVPVSAGHWAHLEHLAG